MELYPEVEFDQIILCGSIVRCDYSWTNRIAAHQVKRALNECGPRDIIVKLAAWAIRDAGPSGAHGFDDVPDGFIYQRRNYGFRHSDYLYRLNYQSNWIPFLKGASAPTDLPEERPLKNWRYVTVKWTVVLVLIVLIILFFIFQPWHSESPASKPGGSDLTHSSGVLDASRSSLEGGSSRNADNYRVRYLQLDDSTSFDAILEGRVKEEYPDLFEKEPFVVRAEVYEFLKRWRSEIEAYRAVLRSKTFSFSRIKSKFEADSSYVIGKPNGSNSETPCNSQVDYAMGFIGAENIGDLCGSYGQFAQFFQRLLAANRAIADLAIEELVVSECDCEWHLEFAYRPLNLLVLDIENIDAQPLKLEDIVGKFQPSTDFQLSPLSDVTPNTGQTMRVGFPLERLRIGEHVLIPMGFFLSSFVDRNLTPKPHPDSLDPRLPEAKIVLGRGKVIRTPMKSLDEQYHNEYTVGPWFTPESVGGLGRIRPFSRSSVVYQGPLAQGSCPYVLAYLPAEKKWEKCGTAISNLKGKELEGESSLTLPRKMNGRLIIREVEREVSYLDQIYLWTQLENGRVVISYPKNQQVRSYDANYVVLRQGQELELEFPIPRGPLKSIQLISRGYFVVNRNSIMAARK